MESRKGILIVSFGTSHMDTLEKTIAAIEQDVRDEFPEYRVYRAFTSQVIIRKLKKRDVDVFTVREALEQMAVDAVETVIVQPTHVINGIEYEQMAGTIEEYSGRFRRISTGTPLLSEPEDYKKAIHALMSEVTLADGEALVLMGHGTQHHANAAYPTLEYTFHLLGYRQVLVGTVEGFPGIGDVMDKLKAGGWKKAVLMPFMIVAGDHAKEDMAGEENSWKTRLEDAGYEVEVCMKGLGEVRGIRSLLLDHMKAVM